MNKNSEEQNEYQGELLKNRLSKKHKALKKWARRERVSCYRLYDRDIPEIPLAIDFYEFLPDDVSDKIECARFLREEDAAISANDQDIIRAKIERSFLHISLYERPYEKDALAEEKWLSKMKQSAAAALALPQERVVAKLRKKQKGENQYEKMESDAPICGFVQEKGQLLKVNLSDYLDTGLFLDHRPLRAIVRHSSAGKSVLNLFCYTGSFSVYAAEGKARRVESVDLSNTYIDWARENAAKNGFTSAEKYVFTRADVTGFLNQKCAETPNADGTNRYDLIILDPPTFSNSKATRNTLDINRDWSELVSKCLNLLNPNGTLYFSTNSKRLKFDESLVPPTTAVGQRVFVEDMTAETLDEDFKGAKIHRCWKFRLGG